MGGRAGITNFRNEKVTAPLKRNLSGDRQAEATLISVTKKLRPH